MAGEPRPVLRDERGITMVEVMAALMVSITGLLGSCAVILALFASASYSRATTEASALARARLEELLAQGGVTTSPPNPPDGTLFEQGLDSIGRQVTGGAYTRQSTWSTISDGVGVRRGVLVEVLWNDRNGVSRRVSVSAQRVP